MQQHPAIHPDDFAFLRDLLKKQIGLSLSSDKEYLLYSRLESVMAKHRFGSMEAMVASLRRFRQTELIQDIAEAMTVNETSFFRDGKPFEEIRQRILPLLCAQSPRRLRFWSAAASTGQEAYSLGMTLLEEDARRSGWSYEILATDVSSQSIEKARQGTYSEFEVQRGMPPALVSRYFTRRPSGNWQVSDALKQMVSFKTHNLLDDFITPGAFDLILCRNVLIYFDADTKRDVLRSLVRHLAPGGVLMLGATESLPVADLGLSLVEFGHAIYRMPEQSLTGKYQASY
jgi:chemotaxis protein methyltransferase CheR